MTSALVSEGTAVCTEAGGRRQSLGSVQLCLALLQGNTAGAEERSCGSWGTPEHWLPADPSVSHAPPGQEKQWVGLARSTGDAGGYLQVGGLHLRSVSHLAALQPLKDDAHLAVRSLAAGTILMMRRETRPATLRDWLAELCC